MGLRRRFAMTDIRERQALASTLTTKRFTLPRAQSSTSSRS
jgi:hypothetical protein